MPTLFEIRKYRREKELQNPSPTSWTFKPEKNDIIDKINIDKDSAIDNFVGNVIASAGDVYGGGAAFLGADETSDAILNKTNKLRGKLAEVVEPGLNWKYLTSKGGLQRSLAEGLGSTLALAPAMALLPESAALAGAGLLGRIGLNKMLSTLATRGAVSRGIAKTIAKGAPTAVRYGVTTAPFEAMAEGGFVRRENLENGMSEDDARIESLKTFAENIPLLTATNTVEGLALGSPFLRNAKGASRFRTAGQIAGRTALESGQNAFEEGVQQIISNINTGKKWNENIGRAAKEGLVGGLGLGLIGAGSHAINKPSKEVEDWLRGNPDNNSIAGLGKINQYYNTKNQINDNKNLLDWLHGQGIKGKDKTANKIIAEAKRQGVDPKIALTNGIVESNLNQNDISDAGAIGVMQLMPETAKSLGVDPYNEDENIRGGIKYLKQQLDNFNGNWRLAFAAYNAGPGAVANAGGIPNIAETKNHVRKVENILGSNYSPNKSQPNQSQNSVTYDAVYKAFQPYDGKTMDNHTVGCVEAATKIGSGYNSFLAEELQKGTVNVDVLRENAEKAGLLSRDVNNIQAGDVLGWDTNGHHHVVIADGKGGFFGNSSTMDKVYHSDKAHSFGKPDWIIKTGGNGITTQTEEISNAENENSLPTLTTETEAEVKKFFRDFVNSKRKSENADDFKNFFGKMTDENGEFQNTPENQNAVLEKFNSEIEKFLEEKNISAQKQNKKSVPDNLKIELFNAVKNLREKAIQSHDMDRFSEIEKILESNDVPAMKKIVADENLNSKPVKNFPYKNISDLKKSIELKLATKEMPKTKAERQKQGRTLKNILQENNIEIDEKLVGALENGLQGAVTKAQEILRQNEILPQIQNQKPVQAEIPVQENPQVVSENQTTEPLQEIQEKQNPKVVPSLENLVQSAMETIAKADAAKNQVQTAPTSKKIYHFDGRKIPQSSEEFINDYENFSENQPLPNVSAERQNQVQTPQEDLQTARQEFWESQEKRGKSERIAKELKSKADKIFQDFLDGKVNAHKTYEKLETLQERASKNTILNSEQKADVENYIEKIKSDIVDYLHGEKTFETSQENISEENEVAENSKIETEENVSDSEEVKVAKDKVNNLTNEFNDIQRQISDAYSLNSKAMTDGDFQAVQSSMQKILQLSQKSLEKQTEIQKAQEHLQKTKQNFSETKKALSNVTDEGNGSNGTTADAPMLTRHAEEDNTSLENVSQKQEGDKKNKESAIKERARRILKSFNALNKKMRLNYPLELEILENPPRVFIDSPERKVSSTFLAIADKISGSDFEGETENITFAVDGNTKFKNLEIRFKNEFDLATFLQVISDYIVAPPKSTTTSKDSIHDKKTAEKIDNLTRDDFLAKVNEIANSFYDNKITEKQAALELRKVENLFQQSKSLGQETKNYLSDYVNKWESEIFQEKNSVTVDVKAQNFSETKKALSDLAEKSWNDKDYNGKVSFTPSKKFRDKVQELFAHDVNEVFITADDVRHIKNKHSEGEEKRGQIDIKPENISEIYDVVNDFDSATKERDDKQGNQNIMVVKKYDGKTFALLVERGKSKAQVKTFYKQKETSQMSDAKSPNLNAQSDSVEVSAENIPQKQEQSKAEKVSIEELQKAFGKYTRYNKKYFTESDFKRGEWVNPYTNKKQAGFVLTRQLPRKEYNYLESVTDGYGVYWFPEVKAFLAPNETKREEFIDYLTGNYKGMPESYAIYQARGNSEVLRTLQDVYDISTYGSYLEKMSWVEAREHAIRIIDGFAKAGEIKYSDGKIEYTNESAKKLLEDLFHINEKTKSVNSYEEIPDNSLVFDSKGISYKGKAETKKAADTSEPEIENQAVNDSSESSTPKTQQEGDKEKSAEKIGKRIEGFDGDNVKIRLKSNAYTEGIYRIVEADDLIASHNADGTKVDKYPAEFQPRDRASEAMINQMQMIAKHTDADILLDMTTNPNEGAPVVRNDGVVLNGNGRIAGIKFAYELSENGESNAIENYRDELIKRAKRFGIDSSEIEEMIAPVLVREVTDNISKENLTELTEAKEGGAKLNPEEQARTDAKKITREMFYSYVPNLKDDLRSKQNEDFVQKVLSKISTETEYPQYFNSEGLTEAGEKRVQQVLLRFAFDSDKLVTNTSSIDTDGRNLQNALEKSAATFAKIKMDMRNHADLEQYDISAIKDAAEKYLELKRQGKKISDYLNEEKLETEGECALKKDSEEMRELLRGFDKFTRSGEKLNDFVKKIAGRIVGINDLNGSDMFGTENPSFLEIIEEASETAGIKFAGKGELTEIFRNAKRLSENELNNKQKMWLDFGEQSGFKVVWLDAHKNLFGAVEDGIIYLNANSNKNTAQTFHHEQFHILSALNPKLHSEIIDYFVEKFDKKQIENYRKNNQREDLTDAEVVEEILSDDFEQVQRRVKLLQEMSKENPNLVKRFITFMKNLLDKFVSAFRKPKGGMTREQSDIFVKKFNSLADSLVLNLPKNSNLKMDLKFSAEKSVDNSNKITDNVENHLTDNHKTNLFNFVNRHIENHVKDQLSKGVSEEEIFKELNSEHSSHRTFVLGHLKAKLHDLQSRANDSEAKRFAVEKINKIEGLSDSQIDSLYEKMVDEWQEMVNYAGVLYREIALDRRTNRGQPDRFFLSSWRDAERQRDEREGRTENRINANHSVQGGFSFEEKISAAIENDPTFEVLIKNLGGKIVDGKLVASEKTKSKIAKQLDDNGKVKLSIAWHGSPHDFDSFNLQAIGTGEGGQAHGWGLYFAENREVSEGYQRRLSGVAGFKDAKMQKAFENLSDYSKMRLADWNLSLDETIRQTKDYLRNFVAFDESGRQEIKALQKDLRLLKKLDMSQAINGRLFKVEIPDADVLLDEDNYFSEQPEKVQQALKTFENFEPKTTGREIYKTLSKKFGDNKAASEALNKAGIKGITYDGYSDGRCYVIFDDKAIKILEKYSRQGNGNTEIKNFVADEDLNSQQKLLKDFSGKMGATLQFFRNDNKDFHGAYSGDVIYLNEKSNIALGKVFWHESLHWLKSNNPKLYNELAKAVNLSDEQLQSYLDTTGRKDLKNDAEITEEILADSLHKILDKVQDKSLLQKVMAWIQDAFTKFKEMFHNPKGGLTNAQLERLTNAFVRMAKDFKDADGNQIFRFNRKTKLLELASGENLSEFAKVSNKETLDNEADMNQNTENEIFDDYLEAKHKNFAKEKINSAIRDMDFSKIKSIADLRNARDNTNLLKILNHNFHNENQSKENKKLFAVWAEYGRRCFENDERIKKFVAVRLGKVRDGQGQGNFYENGQETVSNSDDTGIRRTIRESDGSIRRYVTAEHIDSHNEFLRLYNEKAVAKGDAEIKIYSPDEKNNHSMQGGFSFDNLTVAKNLDGKFENGEWIFSDEKSKRDFEHHLKNIENNFEGAKFSLSDNSNESWTQKFTKTLSAWWRGENKTSNRFHRRQTQLLEKVTDYKISYRHLLEDSGAIIDRFYKIIKVEDYYDWKNLLPKVGEVIAEKLNLPKSDEMNNYIADWIFTGAVNNTSQEAKQFQAAMRENPAMFEMLEEISQNFQNYAKLPANEQMKSLVVYQNENKKSPKQKFERFYESTVDDKSPLQNLVEEYERLTGKKVASSLDPHMQAALVAGADGVARMLVETKSEEGIARMQDALKLRQPLANVEGLTSLNKIVEKAGGKGNIEDFNSFILAKHFKELNEINRKEGKEKYYIQEEFTEKKCDEVIREGEEKFGDAHKDLMKYCNFLLDVLYHSGKISAKEYYKMKQLKNYAPTHRVFDEVDDIKLADSLKHKTGGGEAIINPLGVIANNTVKFIRAAEINKFKIKLANFTRCAAYGKLISEEETAGNRDTTVVFHEDGKKKYLSVTPAIKRAVDSLTGNQMQEDFLFSTLRLATAITRSCLTEASLDFSVANPVRDVQEAYIYNKNGSRNPLYLIKAIFKGYGRVFKAFLNHIGLTKNGGIKFDKDYQEWVAMGGSQATLVSSDIDVASDLVKNLNKTNWQKWISNPIAQLIRSMQSFSEELENSTRLEIYKHNKIKSGDKASLSDMREAAFDSRNATIDFARMGSGIRKANRYIAFLNANIQSWDKSARLLNPKKLATKEGRAELFDTIFKISVSTIPLALFQAAFNAGDDDYKYSVQDWQKESNWIFGDMKIPKSYELLSRISGTIAEDFFGQMFGGESLKSERYKQIFVSALPSIFPTIFTPAVEAYADYSFFFGNSIVPKKEAENEKFLQYGKNTTETAKFLGGNELSKKLSEILFGNDEGFSPRKIDHMLKGYFGFPGKVFTGLIDFATKENYSLDATDFPMTKRFLFDPLKNPQIVQDYYEARETLKKKEKTFKETGKKPDGFDEKLWKKIKANERVMKNISKQEKAILENEKLPADEVKNRLHDLERKRIEICKKVFNKN